MIFFRALPFSFSIMWRYLLVLPLLIVALIMFAIVATIPMLVLGLISPLIGLVMIIAFGIASSIVPIMVGSRVGLQSYNVKPANTYAGLMLPAIGYGLLEAVCMIVMLAISVGVFVMFSPIGAPEFLTAGSEEILEIIVQMVDENSPVTIALFAMIGVLAIALRAALLVPFTGASVGADPDGRKHTPFYGFGERFGSMFSLVTLSYILSAFAVPLAVLIASPFGLAADMAATDLALEGFDDRGFTGAGDPYGNTLSYSDLPIFGLSSIVFIVATFFISLFAFSIQCAGAVLVYMENKGAYVLARKSIEAEMMTKEPDAPMENTDMMELMRSRMKNRNG